MVDTYQPSPAIPPGFDPAEWTKTAAAAESEAFALMSAGVDPNSRHPGVGRSARQLRIEANLRAVEGLQARDASIGASLWLRPLGPQIASSHDALRSAQEAHALSSWGSMRDPLNSYLTSAGLPPLGDVGALRAVTARATQNITHDFQRLSDTVQHRLADSLRRATVSGMGARQAAALVSQTTGFAYSRGMNIARTEMGDLYTATGQQAMIEVGARWEWRAQGDACPICQALHGEVFEAEEPNHRHHQCRCVMIPVTPLTPPSGEHRTAEQIYAGNGRPGGGIPKSWPQNLDRDQLSALVQPVDNPRWRPSYRMTKPPPRGEGGMVEARIGGGRVA